MLGNRPVPISRPDSVRSVAEGLRVAAENQLNIETFPENSAAVRHVGDGVVIMYPKDLPARAGWSLRNRATGEYAPSDPEKAFGDGTEHVDRLFVAKDAIGPIEKGQPVAVEFGHFGCVYVSAEVTYGWDARITLRKG